MDNSSSVLKMDTIFLQVLDYHSSPDFFKNLKICKNSSDYHGLYLKKPNP